MAKTAQRRRRRGQSEPEQTGQGINWKPIVIGGVVIAGIGALFALLFLSLREAPRIEGLVDISGLSRGHDDLVSYPDTGLPPAGGVHANIWQNCGIYDQPVNSANVVHSLEHGAVWLAYSPDLPAADVAYLQDQVRPERFVVMSPFPGLRSSVVMTAWGLQLELDNARDKRVTEFMKQYQQGPQTPEPGATCSDGVGTPSN